MPETPKDALAKARKSGADRSGLRHGLKVGKLAKDAAYIELAVNKLRRQLEDAVLAARGTVTLTDASLIQTACRFERHGAMANRWLRLKAGEMKPSELLTYSREIAKSSAERDKAIGQLRLDLEPESAPWVNLPTIRDDDPEALE